MQSIVTTIDLLRHGKPEGGEIFRGATDVLLSNQGWQQMHDAVAQAEPWQRIVSSPMKRCHAFAEQLAERHQLPISLHEGIREISFGEWDGMAYSQVREQYGELFDLYWRDPHHYAPPHAEPITDFCQRVQLALWQLVEQYRGQHVLMVTHGGVIRAILAEILQAQAVSLLRYEVPYASFSRVRIYHDEAGNWPQLVFFNRG